MNSHKTAKRGADHRTPSLLRVIFLALFLHGFFAGPLTAKEIVDMTGKAVTIPDTITKVFGVTPPATYLIYAIEPSAVCGLNFPLWDNEKKYTVESYTKQPVIGGLVGQGRSINREVLLQLKPDFLLLWAWKEDGATKRFTDSLAELNFPMASVRLDSIEDYPEALLFLGEAMNKKERGQQLNSYAVAAIKEAKSIAAEIPDQEKVTVYYAEGPDGLATDRANSMHTELIPLAGGINVHKGDALDHFGMEKISMEQIMLYDPDVILVKEKVFFDVIFTSPRWQTLRAVRDKHVYLIPYVPFNWFDRPPSFMRLLGIKWLLHTLHPARYHIDMVAEVQKFYSLFLQVNLSEDEAKKVLAP